MEVENTSCPLKDNTLKDLHSLKEDSTKSHDVDAILQVIQIKPHEGKGKETFVVTLRDLSNKHNGFIFVKNEGSPDFEENDILNITKLNVRKLNTGKKGKVFIVKEYEVLYEYKGQNFNLKEATTYEEPPEKESQMDNYFGGEEEEMDPNSTYIPLKQLTTFSRDIFIQVRITSKSELKNFTNSNTPNGKLFTLNIIDKQGTEMQITCFNKVAEKFYQVFEKDAVYEIKGGYVKLNDKKYSAIKSDYKIILDDKTIVKKMDDDGEIKRESLSICKISEIAEIKLYSIIDLCCVVLEVGEKKTLKTKNGEQIIRKIVIGDSSKYKVELSLWRNYADMEIKQDDILLVHHVKVGDFNGRNISTAEATKIEINPENTEAENLKIFISNFDGEYSTLEKTSENGAKPNLEEVLDFKYIKDIIGDDYSSEKMVPIKGTITQISHSEKNYYVGCANPNCRKKITKKDGEENYVCPSCNTQSEKPAYYYTLSVKVRDCSGEYWINIFDKTGEVLTRVSAEDYKDFVVEKNQEKLKEVSEGIEYKDFIFWVKPKNNTYEGNTKKRLYAYKVEPVKDIHFSAILKNADKMIELVNNSGY